jgi:hypothetical protein
MNTSTIQRFIVACASLVITVAIFSGVLSMANLPAAADAPTMIAMVAQP